MKLVINYDFFNAIRNVNEPYTPLKIVRNRKRYFITYGALVTALDFATKTKPAQTILSLAFMYGSFITADYIVELIANSIIKNKYGEDNKDIYAGLSKIYLSDLVDQLTEINVKTNYDMLLKSELYEKEYKFEHNEKTLLALTEKKYIYVPTYGFDGKEQTTSILQEHDIGTRDYTLSVGEPDKQYRLVRAKNHA